MDEVKQENIDSRPSNNSHEPFISNRDRLARGRRDFLKSILVGVPAIAAACSTEGRAVTTDTAPTLSPDQQVQTGSGEFVEGDSSLNSSLKDLLQSNYHIEIPEGASTPFSIDVEGSRFEFIALAPLEFKGWGFSWDEKVFMRLDNTLSDLDRREVAIDSNQLVVWSYVNSKGIPEPVLWYPKITQAQWQEMTPRQKKDFYAGFAPPSPLEKEIPAYSRDTNIVFAISFDGLAEGAANAIGSKVVFNVANPTAEPTARPEPTATKEPKQFNVCSVENFRDCRISAEDLLDGSYLNWLKTIAPQISIPPKLWITPIGDDEENGIPPTELVLHWEGSGTAIRGDVTAAYIPPTPKYGNKEYAVLTMFLANPNNPGGASEPIICVTDNLEGVIKGGFLETGLKKWKSNRPPYGFFTDSASDPLLAKAFKLHPDMQKRIENFLNTGDPSLLNAPGVLLRAAIFLTSH